MVGERLHQDLLLSPECLSRRRHFGRNADGSRLTPEPAQPPSGNTVETFSSCVGPEFDSRRLPHPAGGSCVGLGLGCGVAGGGGQRRSVSLNAVGVGACEDADHDHAVVLVVDPAEDSVSASLGAVSVS